MLMRTQPESQARMMKPSTRFADFDWEVGARERRDRRMRIGIRASVMRDQSSAIKPAVYFVSSWTFLAARN